jgi:hypothetical protein
MVGLYACLLSSRRVFLANRPGDHGTVPVRRTYASLENDGPFRGQPSSRGHKLKQLDLVIIAKPTHKPRRVFTPPYLHEPLVRRLHQRVMVKESRTTPALPKISLSTARNSTRSVAAAPPPALPLSEASSAVCGALGVAVILTKPNSSDRTTLHTGGGLQFE